MKKIICIFLIITMFISVVPVTASEELTIEKVFSYIENMDFATRDELFYNLMYVYLSKDKDTDTIINIINGCTDTSQGVFDNYIRKILNYISKDELINTLSKVKNIPEKYRKPRFMNFYTQSSGDTEKKEIPNDKKTSFLLLWKAFEKNYNNYFKLIKSHGTDEKVVADFLPLFYEMNNNKSFLKCDTKNGYNFFVNEIDSSLNKEETEKDLNAVILYLNKLPVDEKMLISNVLSDFKIAKLYENKGSEGDFGSAPITDNKVIFLDIGSHWGKDYILNLVSNNIIKGYEDNTFRPDNYVTREEAAVIIARLFKKEKKDTVNKFKDDGNISTWAKDSVYSLVSDKMINGYSDNTFNPGGNITREELLAIILRGLDLSFDNNKDLLFADKDLISTWAKDIVNCAVQNGIINGYSDNTFKPQDNITRAELSVVISKILNKM